MYKCKEDFYVGKQDKSKFEVVPITPLSKASMLKDRIKNEVFTDYISNIDMTEKYTLPPDKTGGFLCCGGNVRPKIYLE